MLVSEIIDEVKEGIGKCSDAFALRTITRAVQLLANKNLIDPLIGYFDFSLGNDWFVALPRDCKTPLRININKQPAFSRARLYEFHINSEGTTDADEPGLSWSDRGYSPIQNEKALPGKLRYKVTNSADSGKGITVFGLDENGREQEETLVGHLSSPTEGAVTFHKVVRIIREVTTAETFLWCNGENISAQYYADETLPEYRVIKLSKKAAAVRVMFRRHVFSVRTVDDFIPMHSHLAVVHACKAVRFLGTDEYDKATAALTMAETFLREEQASREEHNTIASQQEVQPAIDASIYVRDSIIAADVYDVAADIFGPVGRRKLLDKITTAIELLSNKGQWDPRLGVVDVFTADNRGAVTYDTPLAQDGRGHGFYVLPRHVEIPVAINYKCGQTIPRNRWFEFHMNGDGGMEDRSSCRTWDDAGDVCIIRRLPLESTEEPARRRVRPTYLVAVPDDSADNNIEVRIYGFERDTNGKDVEVWRAGQRGWLCPCVAGSYDPGEDAPRWTAIERITKAESRAFIRLYETTYTPAIPAVEDVYTTAVSALTEATLGGTPFTATNLDISNFGITPAWGSDSAEITAVFKLQSAAGDYETEVFTDGGEFAGYTGTMTVGVNNITADGNDYAVVIDSGAPSGLWLIQAAQTLTPGTPGVSGFWSVGELYGMWYPDELEPKYRMIKLPHSAPARIRMAYRKRTPKLTSIYEPIPLRSRFAIEQMLRGIKASETDPTAAQAYEAAALRYLREERINQGPSATGILQYEESTSPGFTGNVQ